MSQCILCSAVSGLIKCSINCTCWDLEAATSIILSGLGGCEAEQPEEGALLVPFVPSEQ